MQINNFSAECNFDFRQIVKLKNSNHKKRYLIIDIIVMHSMVSNFTDFQLVLIDAKGTIKYTSHKDVELVEE